MCIFCCFCVFPSGCIWGGYEWAQEHDSPCAGDFCYYSIWYWTHTKAHQHELKCFASCAVWHVFVMCLFVVSDGWVSFCVDSLCRAVRWHSRWRQSGGAAYRLLLRAKLFLLLWDWYHRNHLFKHFYCRTFSMWTVILFFFCKNFVAEDFADNRLLPLGSVRDPVMVNRNTNYKPRQKNSFTIENRRIFTINVYVLMYFCFLEVNEGMGIPIPLFFFLYMVFGAFILTVFFIFTDVM